MAIGFRGYATGDLSSIAGTTTVSFVAGTAATDVVVVVFGTDATTETITPPSGATRIGSQVVQNQGGGTVINLDAFWCLGSQSNNGFTNGTTGAFQQGWVAASFTGVDNTTPIDVAGVGTSTSGNSSVTANSITIVTAGAWECIAGCDWLGKVPFAATSFSEAHNAATNASASLLYNQTGKSTGATGSVSVSNSDGTSTGELIAVLPFALRPAASSIAFPSWDEIRAIFRDRNQVLPRM